LLGLDHALTDIGDIMRAGYIG